MVPSKTRREDRLALAPCRGGPLAPTLVLSVEGITLDWPDAMRHLAEARERDLAVVGASARFEQLGRAIARAAATKTAPAYAEQHGVAGVRRFRTRRGAREFHALSVEDVPPAREQHLRIASKATAASSSTCGSAAESARRDLTLGFAVMRATFHEDVRWEALDACVVSHAHFDHFGGANRVKAETQARLLVHELDARVLSCFGERLVIASKLRRLLAARRRDRGRARLDVLTLYTSAKSAFVAQEVDRVLRDGDTLGPGYKVHHVPGHCPGLICLQVHDVLLTSDHVLSRITPHQFPQATSPRSRGSSTTSTRSPRSARSRASTSPSAATKSPSGISRARVDAIAQQFHPRIASRASPPSAPRRRPWCRSRTTSSGTSTGYARILAVDEAGAHVEYLHQLGRLSIANLDEGRAIEDPGHRVRRARRA